MEEEEHYATLAVPGLEVQMAATMVQRVEGLRAKVFALAEGGRNLVVELAGKLSIHQCPVSELSCTNNMRIESAMIFNVHVRERDCVCVRVRTTRIRPHASTYSPNGWLLVYIDSPQSYCQCRRRPSGVSFVRHMDETLPRQRSICRRGTILHQAQRYPLHKARVGIASTSARCILDDSAGHSIEHQIRMTQRRKLCPDAILNLRGQ